MFSILKIYFEKYFFIKLINIMTENKEDMVRITYYIIQEIFYEIITETIKSNEFKIPIKNFVDEHCIFFDKLEENSFEHTTIHNVNN